MNFIYRAYDKKGEEIRGIVVAKDKVEAQGKLRENGLIIVEIKQQDTEQYPEKNVKETYIHRIFNQLSVLLKAGVSLDSALKICIDSIENSKVSNLLEQILMSIKSGREVHLAFQETGQFSQFIITMIRIGEKTGALKETFSNIADYVSFNIKFKAEVKNAMMYPSFLIAASFITVLGIFNVIIPRFFSIFAEGTERLPIIAKILYNISQALNLKNILILIFLFGLMLIPLKIKMINFRLQRIFDYLTFLPLIKRFFIEFELSRFCFAMSSMLRNRVDFTDALKYSSDLIKNETIKKTLKKTIPLIREGKSISIVFGEISFLPPIVKGTLKVGEESGQMAEMFYELYIYFDDKFKNNIRKFLNLLEPTIITVMGIVIGLIVLSLILTIMSVSNIKL